MLIHLKARSYVSGRKLLAPGEHDLSEAEIKALGLELPEPEPAAAKKKKVAAKPAAAGGGDA